MDALISGRGGVALVVNGDYVGSIHVAEPDRLVPRQPRELRFLIGEGKDFVALENVSQEEITCELLQARACEEALLRALAVLDTDVPSDLRSEIVKELEVLLADERVAVNLENVLYAEPLPEEADMKGALAVAREAEAKGVLSLYEFLWTRQEEVRLVRTAWNAIPRELFAGQRQRWQFFVIREGVFRFLVLATAMGHSVRQLFAEVLAFRALQPLPNHQELLQAWFDPFFQRYSVAREADPAGALYGEEVAEPTVRYRPSLHDVAWGFKYLDREVLPLEGLPADPVSRPASALRFPADAVIGDSPAIRSVLEKLEATVGSELEVLLVGEAGTGKGVFAQTIHISGPSSGGPFLAVNCAAIPSELLEAELFGVAGRASTGVEPRAGLFLKANGGTLFLDEIGELSASLQVKLLRVIQEREVLPLGASRAKPFRGRIVSASNRDFEELMERGFRSDLYYGLAQLSFRLPSLRERPEDIPNLVFHFASHAARQYDKSVCGISRKALDYLLAYSWPGNIPELRNVVERSVLLCPDDGTIESAHLPLEVMWGKARENTTLQAVSREQINALELDAILEALRKKREAILEALRKTRGNKTQAARRLRMTLNGLDLELKRLELSASDWGLRE